MATRMANQEAWNEQFEGINFLRVMNKFHLSLLIQNLNKFEVFLQQSVMNLRSGIQQNSLMFTSEFFKNNFADCDDTLKQFVKCVLPSVLFKTVYDKKFISNLAKASVVSSFKSCPFIETLEILLEDGCLCKSNNKKLIEFSFEFIDQFFQQVDNVFLEPIIGKHPTLMKLVNQVYDGTNSAPRIKKPSVEVFKNLK